MAGGQILQIAEGSIGAERCELRLDGELDLWSIERPQAVLQRIDGEYQAIVAGLTEAGIVFDSRDEAIAELAVVE